MINTICYTLGTAFSGTTIYREDIGQPVSPAFHVRTIETNHIRRIGNLYKRQCQFVIKYFTKEEGLLSDYETLADIADKLYRVLEYMEFEGRKLRGTGMKHRIEDNVVQFFVTCTEQLKHDIQDPAMEELKEELRKKG